MAIPGHPLISNRTHECDLPASWRTLYELTKVEPKVLQAAIKDGPINPATSCTRSRGAVIAVS
jgi:hypothetical protein